MEGKSTFRLTAKNLYLTWPQNKCPPEIALENAVKYFKSNDIKFIVVGQEEHKDGNPHLHMVVSLNKKRNVTKPGSLDVIAGGHGEYQSARDLNKCVLYCIKEDNWLVYGLSKEEILDSTLPKTMQDKVAKMVERGKTDKEIFDLHPGAFLRMQRQITSLRQKVQVWTHLKQVAMNPLQMRYLRGLKSTPSGTAIYKWIKLRLYRRRPMKLKDPHLWIKGESNLGKTTLWTWLDKHLKIYEIPLDENFYDFFPTSHWDCAVIDEFKGQKTIQWLNRWLDGSRMTLRVKGAQALKTNMIPTIILSNFSPEECYPQLAISNPERIQLLHNRVTFVELTSKILIKNL